MPEKPESPWRQVNRYFEIGMTFPAALVAGLLIGYGLDRLLGTTFLYLVCMLLGVAGAFVQLLRLLSKK
jgi:F0F1-type ATP synthase assembly protein I